jgi:chitin disaccharide deacetylase
VTTAPSLAERLGHGSATPLLIVNADDFGTHHGANVAIVEGFRHGSLSSTSLMVPCPWAAGAAIDTQHAVAEGITMDVGVHLTLTSEWPKYRWASITGHPVLHGHDGRMHVGHAQFHSAVSAAGADGMAAVRAECAAQIELALTWGVDVTHLDGHMGVIYSSAELLDIIIDLAAEYRLPMRMVSPSRERSLGFECRQPAADRGVLFPDSFVETYLDARPRHERVLASLRPGVTEILLHPAIHSDDLFAAFDDGAERVANYGFTLPGGGLLELVHANGIRLVGFRALRDAQRADD